MTTRYTAIRLIPPSIWVLGGVSMLMDISSELIHGLLPVFLVSTLGASAFSVGLIEGAAEATALIVKVFSGTLSDVLGRRKVLVVLGYGLGALSKPLFALATSPGFVLTARLVDRVGKGVRGAPRDALVADLAPAYLRGTCYGLRQALDSVGAFVGPRCHGMVLLQMLCRRVQLHQHITDFAHGTLAARQVRDIDGTGAVFRPGIGDGAGTAYSAQGWQVVDVVTHIRHVCERQAKAEAERFERGELIVDAEEDVRNAKPSGTLLHGGRGIATDERDLDAGLLHQLNTLPIPDVEFFHFFAALGVVQAAIGEDTVHIQD